jgi:hypothetical protein
MVHYDKTFPLNLIDRKSFENYIKEAAETDLCRYIKRNLDYLDSVLKPFELTGSSLIHIIKTKNLIRVQKYRTSFQLYYSPIVYYNISNKKVRISYVIKAIDYGSSKTGLPKPIFHRIFKYIEDNISYYYIGYIGKGKQ